MKREYSEADLEFQDRSPKSRIYILCHEILDRVREVDENSISPEVERDLEAVKAKL